MGYVFTLLASLGALATLRRDSLSPGVIRGAAAFVLMTLLDLLTSSLGDVLDVIRHHFVFTAMSDMVFIFALALILLPASESARQAT